MRIGLASGLATLLVGGVLFGASALAQSNPPGRPGAAEHQKRETELVQKVAAKLGKTEDQVRDAFIAAKQEMVDDAVKAGRLTQQQGDVIKQRIQQSGGLGGFRVGGPRGGSGGPGGPGGPMREAVANAAQQYLGLSSEELRAQLRAGKSLADITRERGKDLNELKSRIATALRSQIDAAVDAGRLPKERADAMKAQVDKHVDQIVNRKFGQKPGPGPRHGGQ